MKQSEITHVLERATPGPKKSLPGVLFGILSDGSAVALLALSMWLIVKSGEQPPILHLTFAIVSVRAFAIGRAAFRYVERIASHDAALGQLASLRADTFRSLVDRVPGAIESSRRGEVLATFVDDVDQLQDHPLRVRQPLWVSLVVTALAVTVVAVVSPVAGLLLTIVLATTGVLGASMARRIAGKSDRELSEARSALTDVLLERFAAAEVLSAFDSLPVQRARIRAAEDRFARVQRDRTAAAGLTGALVALGAGLSSLALLWLLAPAVGSDAATGFTLSAAYLSAASLTAPSLTAPLFAAIVVVPAAIFEVFAQVFAAFIARRTVNASAARVASLTDSALPAEIPEDPVVDTALTASEFPILSVRNFEASHPGGNTPIEGLNFMLEPGDLILVTGESGSGKSTLALALVKFLNYGGSYRLGGHEVHTMTGATVRSTVGLCEQQPHIFDSDLRQNLKFARPEANDAELFAVLDRVGLGDWARERGGLDAALGERGTLVSGGQAQRISLARAILADFPILILDEPTAGVDQELADALLHDLLGAIPQNRAIILISHTQIPEGIRVTRELRL